MSPLGVPKPRDGRLKDAASTSAAGGRNAEFSVGCPEASGVSIKPIDAGRVDARARLVEFEKKSFLVHGHITPEIILANLDLELPLFKCKSLLDVGCGKETDFPGWCRRHGVNAMGIDLKERLPVVDGSTPSYLVVGGVEAIPFPDETFDFVISNFVLNHIKTDEGRRYALKEMLRVAKPGGSVVSIPIGTFLPAFTGSFIGSGAAEVFARADAEQQGRKFTKWLTAHKFTATSELMQAGLPNGSSWFGCRIKIVKNGDFTALDRSVKIK